MALEAAGIVAAVGEGVQGVEPGDAVSVVPPLSMVRWPAYGDVATFPAELVVKHPPSLSWETAAAVWMQHVTAYGALIDIAKLRKEDFVVITAASSSVGLAAIQIATMVGATPVAVTRTSAKKQALRAFGAAHVIASAEEDLEARLKDIAGSGGVRVVFDAGRRPGVRAVDCRDVARRHPHRIWRGRARRRHLFRYSSVLSKHLTLRGYLIHEIVSDPARLEAAKAFILGGLRNRVRLSQ